MTNDGTSLERLVALIEGRLVPAGFRVETRKRLFDDGIQVAEFDIVISGSVGTSEISVLIECRDRPARGPAPTDWIEQLAGRRSNRGFAAVMAVSGPGFSPGATDTATRLNVELRQLQSLTPEDVVQWLPTGKPPLQIRNHELTAVRLVFDPPDLPTRPVRVDENALIETQTGVRTSAIAVWQKVLEKAAVWADVPIGSPVERTIRTSDHLAERYSIEVDGRTLPVHGIEFDARLEVRSAQMRLVEARQYGEVAAGVPTRDTIADVVRWVAEGDALVKEFTIVAFRKRGQNGDST